MLETVPFAVAERAKTALLVRVGVDDTAGGWNAPVDADGRFVYVPIPEPVGTPARAGLGQGYYEVLPALDRFCAERQLDLVGDLKFPAALRDRTMHLDPDFSRLTYGDVGTRRGKRMGEMRDGDVIVFYAGLRPVYPCEQALVYALVGLYVVADVVHASFVPPARWAENAHTRRSPGADDIIVRAKPGVSGRFERAFPIGGWRDNAYRVWPSLLDAWGGLSAKDGFLQRSAVPPALCDLGRFEAWLAGQNVRLLAHNN